MHAEPTTFGAKFALFALQVQRDVERARHARTSIAVGKLSGAVGTFSNIDPAVEKYVCSRLGLEAVPATQVIARDRHAEVLYAWRHSAPRSNSSHSKCATWLAVKWARPKSPSPSARRDRRDAAQAQPRSLGTTVRAQSGTAGYLQADSRTSPSGTSVTSRIRALKGSCCRRAATHGIYVAQGHWSRQRPCVASGARPREPHDRLLGLVFSQSVLLALVDSGMSRDDAYRVVQAAARRAIDERRNFREVVESDDDVTLSNDALARAFDI